MSTPAPGRTERERALAIADLLRDRRHEVIAAWVEAQATGDGPRGPVDDRAALESMSSAVVDAMEQALRSSGRVYDPDGQEFATLRALFADRSRRGAREGSTPSETAHGVLALREALYLLLERSEVVGPELVDAVVTSARLVDSLALLTFETFVRSREEVITAQGDQLLELSTPVVRVWEGVVAVPLIGTLDSSRAQIVMETLLQAIVDEHARVAILDITGVPTFDTLVAQNLIKTVTATRLMGADCIISGIKPQTAQTIVQLGIDLTAITTRATLADALHTAIGRVGDAEGSGEQPAAD